MRVVGYVREHAAEEKGDTAFAQTERIRRWARDSANELVATCEDGPYSPAGDRPGYRALVEIVRSGGVDAVVIASIDALSSDKVLQEVMLSDIRAAGITVISTDTEDHVLLHDNPDDHIRIVVRDIVAKVSDYRGAYGASDEAPQPVTPIPLAIDDTGDPADVVVELIAPTG